MQNEHGTESTPTTPKEAGGKDPLHSFDLNKLTVQFCQAVKAEQIAKKAVLRDLRLRAKSAGKRIRGGTESIVGPERCKDVRWLWATLEQMRYEFVAEIDEDLQKLSQLRIPMKSDTDSDSYRTAFR